METQTLSPVVEAHTPSPIIFTDAAANKVKEIILDEGNAALKLRDLSPLWDMHRAGVDLNSVQWAAH